MGCLGKIRIGYFCLRHSKLLINGNGTFGSTITLDAAGYFAEQLSAGDVDNDGDMDLMLSRNTYPNSGGSVLFDKGICNALPIQYPVGPNADLSTATMSEDRVMWEHWKDHVFYAVSDTSSALLR